jgi:hypothetical protein
MSSIVELLVLVEKNLTKMISVGSKFTRKRLTFFVQYVNDVISALSQSEWVAVFPINGCVIELASRIEVNAIRLIGDYIERKRTKT